MTAGGTSTVVGNPKAGSRTLTAANALADALTLSLADALTETGNAAGASVPRTTIDLATIADGLLAPWALSTAGALAVAEARSASLLVIATPTYKASFTGLLKLFLDVFPAGSLSRTVVVPLTVAGGPEHRRLADLQLRPVLGELGAIVPVPSLLLEESELPQLAAVVDEFVARYGGLIGAAVSAVARTSVPHPVH